VALGADAARQSTRVKEPFEAGIKAHLEILSRLLGEADGPEPSGKATAILSTMVGAVVLSRAVNDNRLAQQILQAAADQIRATIPPKQPRSRR
jgi:TetR/AcrR family transcriptional repressor of nem operon